MNELVKAAHCLLAASLVVACGPSKSKTNDAQVEGDVTSVVSEIKVAPNR